MTSPAGVLRSRWCISLAGTALLAGLAWWFAPLVPSFEDPVARAALMLFMLLIWAVANLLLELRQHRRDQVLASGLTADTAEEAAALRDKLTTALKLLKRSRRSRGYLYEQPWYAIIGPPGAGKTTALLNAGLHFPLASEMGDGAVAGVGGTRLCEWWFTDDAVLIDTAGRYTTQDSNADVDRAGWEAFLDLLRRSRPRQPLNGVIVAISLSDLALGNAAERAAHARAIRERVTELEDRLGVRLPVYAMLTKTDLIAGFTEFFDDFDQEQRAQVWGSTFALPSGVLPSGALPSDASPPGAPPSDGGGSAVDVPGEFRSLLERLNARLFERLRDEPNPDRRALIAMFPNQIASLEQPLVDFVNAAFGGSGPHSTPLLRGIYFTSGTQEGTVIDRLIGSLVRSVGLDQRLAARPRQGQGRSYFLTRLLSDVIFNEAMLVASNPASVRRRRFIRAAGFTVAAVAVLAAGAFLWNLEQTQQRQIDAAQAALRDYEQIASSLPLDPVADADLRQLAPLLDRARLLEVEASTATVPAWCCLGLSQDGKLAAAARAVYRHALERAFLPRLLWRLEAQLRGNMNQPDFLYEATRVYLMLGGSGPVDRGLVYEWMKLDWQAAWPGAEFLPLRETLLLHLDSLLAEPLPEVALDGDLVAQARRTFGGVTLAQRAYSRVRPSAAAQRLPPWRPSDALGPVGAALFLRGSGKPLTDGVAGFFTVDGFHRVFLPALDNAVISVASESWVLGQKVDLDPSGPRMQALRTEMIALYEADYAREWDAMLADLNLRQMQSLPRAAQDLYILASPQSPMRELLASVVRQLRLSVPPTAAGTAQPATNAVQPADVDTDTERLRAVLHNVEPPNPAQGAPGHEIDERYAALLALFGDGSGAPIDLVLKSLIDIQQLIAKQAAAPIGSTPPAIQPGSDPATMLQAAAMRQPAPLSRWLTTIASNAIALRGGNLKSQVAAVFNAPGGPAAVCSAAVEGHYPFTRSATNDVSIEEFSRLFGPGGVLDGFVNTMLRPYIDMSGSTWRPQAADGVPAPVSLAELAQFRRAAKIRDVFWPGRGSAISIRIDVTPVSLDPATKHVTLDLGGTIVSASHDPPHSTQITWPGPARSQTARLEFDPPASGHPGAWEDSGPWSMFRLFNRGKSQTAAPDRVTMTYRIGDREAVFEIRASSASELFMPGLPQEFHCPSVAAVSP